MEETTRELFVVLTTAPDAAVAEEIAAQLLDERRIACANLVPGVRSLYRWEGEVRRDDEVLLLLKTTEDEVGPLTDRIRTLHPYDVPEVLALPVARGLPAYLSWVASETGASGG